MKSRNRTKFIMDIASGKISLFEHSLIPALVNCLGLDEVISMLSVCDQLEASVRRALLNKMEKDVHDNLGTDNYLKLGPILINRYGTVHAKKRGAIRTCLDRMLNIFPDENVSEILIFFLTNKHVSMRRKAFGYLKHTWSDSYEELLIETWNEFSDPEANTLVVAHLDETSIRDNVKRILEIVETSRYKIPVYKKLASIDISYVSHLDKSDRITATYLRAIYNIKISPEDAKKLVESEIMDERYGLLLWSLGRLGHWSALVHAHDLLGKRHGL